MLGKFNPAVLMAAIMGQLAQVDAGKGGGTKTMASGFRGVGQSRRFPTRLMIEKRRNKKKFKLGRTR